VNAPCPTCPWRRSSAVGGADIPGFSIDLMRGLENTVGDEDAFRPMMACHYSLDGGEKICVGYVAREGWTNLAVRLAAIRGELNVDAIDRECADLDLWPSFGEMLAAYEEAAT
jgi:Family of unknown function (DUF6283)